MNLRRSTGKTSYLYIGLSLLFVVLLFVFSYLPYHFEPTEYTEVQIDRVVDGDTLLIKPAAGDESIYVRLIGIDAPESVNPDECRNTDEGIAASDFLKEYMRDYDTVWLETDEEATDVYGRTLAYVWLSPVSGSFDSDDVKANMLNAIILDRGYAEPMSISPNTKYAKVFAQIAKEAD